MTGIVVHLGAHRTGTTYLQQFLKRNSVYLEGECIQLVYPPLSREQALTKLQLTQTRAVVSDENILGTMEENISTGILYPSAEVCLARHSALLKQADKVYLTIRRYDEWWASSITFCAKSGTPLPSLAQINKIARLPRTWNHVVDDVVAAAPQAEVVVREFNWKLSTPKQHLNRLTGWPEWGETTLEKRVHNRRPEIAAIADALLEKGDFTGLSKLPLTNQYEPFTSEQTLHLRESYFRDVERLKKRNDIHFWGEANSTEDTLAVGDTPTTQKPKQRSRVMLHIGKTGGSFLKSALHDKQKKDRAIEVCGHGDTLISTARKFGRDRKLAFVFREPAARFVSGFNSRMRQGRPTYNISWSNAEATAFSFFEHPNDLAEALDDANERMRSAAHFAFNNIFHLKHGYRHFLHSTEALKYEHKSQNIVVCCETHKIDKNLTKIIAALEVGQTLSRSVRHEKPMNQDASLSDRGLANIKQYLRRDFEIYQTCVVIAKDLGFD